jgi:hypothetical protein
MFGVEPQSDGWSYTWGSREKVYRMSGGKVEVRDFSPAKLKRTKTKLDISNTSFSSRNSFVNELLNTLPIATGTAPFGSIVEFDDRLIVLRSDGEIEVFPGEPVHWRVFPRSEDYSNQLHIIYDDHVAIVSFVHDYFVDQKEKLHGFMRGAI